MRVLLVDDELELVSTMAERLCLRGIDADWATNAEDALKMDQAKTYDLAVLDVKMPKVSGLQLKKKLEDQSPGMKFIFLTGHGSEEDFKAATSATGTEYYLVKPINIEDLIQKMKEALGDQGDMV